MKRIVIFDLDETLIDSAHRTPNNPDGTLNLQGYFDNKTRENIFKDSLLPLADVFKNLCRKENYIVICTARCMEQDDWDYLEAHGLHFHSAMYRPADMSENHIKDPILKARKINRLRNLKQFKNLPVTMFDDSQPVIQKMREIGITCLNAIQVNKRLIA